MNKHEHKRKRKPHTNQDQYHRQLPRPNTLPEIDTVADRNVALGNLPSLQPYNYVTQVENGLGPLLVRLRETIHQNNSYLKELSLQLASTTSVNHHFTTRRKKQEVTVELLVAFLHLIDINTKHGYFHAEIYIQAKWPERDLCEASQEELDMLDFSKVWKPDLVLVNAVGEPDDVKTWYSTMAATGSDTTMLYTHMRVRGQFKESLELKDFPVDRQNLTVTVTCEQPASELVLVPNSSELASITLETFNDAKEFRLWGHVDVKEIAGNPAASDKFARSSKVAYTCSVSRRPAYFFINGLLLQFLIALLTFLVFLQPPDAFTTRSSLAATLLLTSVAFQFTVLGDLPNVPYVTYLGIYHLVCRIFQVVIIIESGIVFYMHTPNKSTALLVDRITGGLCITTFVLFNILYIVILCYKYYSMHKLLTQKEKDYYLRKYICEIKTK